MKQIQDAYIVAATRTPIGRSHRGFFRNTRPDDLLATILRAAVAQVPRPAPRAEGPLVETNGKRIRIQAVDAPDIESRLCKRALIEMRLIVGRDPVRCQLLELEAPTGKGRQAWVARCMTGDTDIGQELVRRGWARCLRRDCDSEGM